MGWINQLIERWTEIVDRDVQKLKAFWNHFELKLTENPCGISHLSCVIDVETPQVSLYN